MLVRGCEGGAFWLLTCCFRLMFQTDDPFWVCSGTKSLRLHGVHSSGICLFQRLHGSRIDAPPTSSKDFDVLWQKHHERTGFEALNLDSQSLMFASSVFSTHLFPRFFICDPCRTFDQLGEITPETRCTWESKSNRTCCLADFFKVKTILRSSQNPNLTKSVSRGAETWKICRTPRNGSPQVESSKKKHFFLGKTAKHSRLLLIKELRDVR